MKLRFVHIVLTILLFSSCNVKERSVSVVSLNVRYDNADDGINRWDNRKELVLSFFEDESPDIIGCQEVLSHQLNYLKEHMAQYCCVSAGREDGKEAGEMVPVFFKKDKFELISSSHFWLSNTPEIAGSKSWGTHFPRIVSWVQLKNLENGYIFYVFNTHLSHISEFARTESAILLLDKIQLLAGDAPVILLGDFNSTIDSDCYQTLTGSWIDQSPLWDTRFENLDIKPETHTTYNGFENDKYNLNIDHIFVSSKFLVQSFNTYPIKKKDVFISDHYPVKAVLLFSLNDKKKSGEPKELIPSLPDPVIDGDNIVFSKKTSISITTPENHAAIYYTLDGSLPDTSSSLYSSPIKLNKTSTISAFAYEYGKKSSNVVSKTFIRKGKASGKVINIFPPKIDFNSNDYEFLFNQKYGNKNSIDNWLKIEDSTLVVTLRLNKLIQINELYISHLSQPQLGIVSPKSINISVSVNGKNYEDYGFVNLVPSTDAEENKNLLTQISGQKFARYVKIKFINPNLTINKLTSKLMIDEIVVL
nr:FN3 associated domain-containing protein [uncultured Carboxylicivirga sp.]